jgi:hypothetical protein
VDETKSSAPAHTTTDPATRAGDPFAYAGDPRGVDQPRGCALCMSSGFVFFGVETEDGEEEIERVPCRRCHPEVR